MSCTRLLLQRRHVFIRPGVRLRSAPDESPPRPGRDYFDSREAVIIHLLRENSGEAASRVLRRRYAHLSDVPADAQARTWEVLWQALEVRGWRRERTDDDNVVFERQNERGQRFTDVGATEDDVWEWCQQHGIDWRDGLKRAPVSERFQALWGGCAGEVGASRTSAANGFHQ